MTFELKDNKKFFMMSLVNSQVSLLRLLAVFSFIRDYQSKVQLGHLLNWQSGPSCSKLTTSLVNVSSKFQTLISQIRQYFLLKKCEKLSHFFNKKYQCIWLQSRKTLNELTS